MFGVQNVKIFPGCSVQIFRISFGSFLGEPCQFSRGVLQVADSHQFCCLLTTLSGIAPLGLGSGTVLATGEPILPACQ